MHARPDSILLLVEDSEDDAYFFKRTFAKAGLAGSIQLVTNGAEAIEFLQRAAVAGSPPHIIFLDLKMPVCNGFDVLSWMKRHPWAAEIPVVVLSGSEQPEDLRRSTELGAIDYVIKPITMSVLQRHLLGDAASTKNPSPMEKGAMA